MGVTWLKKTVVYYRRSTNIQEHSISMQEHKAFQKARELKLIIDDAFLDDAVSGRKTQIDQRQELNKLLEQVKQGKIETLLVYKRDRLAREVMQYLEIYETLKRHNVKVIFTADNEPPMMDGPAGKLFELLLGAMIQREGEQIVERIKESIIAGFKSGKNPGTLPFGYSYDREKEQYNFHEEELNLVHEMYKMISNGKTLKEVTKFASAVYPDKKWTSTVIKSLLINPTYMGYRMLRMQGQEISQEYPNLAIIDAKTWGKVVEIISPKKTGKKGEVSVEVDFLLTGILYCKNCMRPLQGKPFLKNEKDLSKYKCQDCKVEVPKIETEELVINASLNFVKRLLQDDFSSLMEGYKERNLKKNWPLY